MSSLSFLVAYVFVSVGLDQQQQQQQKQQPPQPTTRTTPITESDAGGNEDGDDEDDTKTLEDGEVSFSVEGGRGGCSLALQK